jgi:hypothetical protein
MFLSSCAALVTGCSGLRSRDIPVAAASAPRDPFKIFWIHSYQVERGLLVTGRVLPRSSVARSSAGHLLVTANLADGRQVLGRTRWTSLPRRGRGAASFSVLLPMTAPDQVSRIAIEYRAIP